jgi:flagellar hook assembly protein FlgD
VDELKIYPNPVRNDYFGPIAIDGVASNSSVKITDEAGNIVNLLVSKGGQAIWDGTDFNGDRVATGVYFVLAVDKTGKKSTSGKILVLK